MGIALTALVLLTAALLPLAFRGNSGGGGGTLQTVDRAELFNLYWTEGDCVVTTLDEKRLSQQSLAASQSQLDLLRTQSGVDNPELVR